MSSSLSSHKAGSASSKMAEKLSISVTLTNMHDPNDTRHLTLFAGEPVTIGRSSKSESKNLQPSSTNTLFDCPVVSRIHAQLEAHAWASSDDEVTIEDRGSLHGTHINGKAIGKERKMSLRSGDTIRFGANVTRSDGSHDGIVVTFHKIKHLKPVGSVSTSTACRGFQVPEDYTDEESNDSYSPESDDEARDENAPSSAKTTPEQAKSFPGSAAQPIDLDNVPAPSRPTVINLDDEAEYIPPSPSKPRYRATLPPRDSGIPPAPHSFDRQLKELILIPESIDQEDEWHPVSPILSKMEDVLEANSHESKEENDVDDIVDAALEPEYEDAGFDDLYDYSDEELSDIYDEDEVPFEDDEPHSYSAQRQVSPELESPPFTQMQQRVPLASQNGISYGYTPTDPLRPISFSQHAYAPIHAPQTTLYLPKPVQLRQAMPSIFSSSQMGSNQAHPHSGPTLSFIAPSSQHSQPDTSNTSIPERRDQQDSCDWMSCVATSSKAAEGPSRQVKSHMSRITIPELVDEIIKEPNMTPQINTATTQMDMSGSDQMEEKPAVESAAAIGVAAGKKRKAEEISIGNVSDGSHESRSGELHEVKDVVMTMTDKVEREPDVLPYGAVPPMRKKLKVRRQRNIAGEVVKYAAAAAVGGAATIALLISPLGEWVASGSL